LPANRLKTGPWLAQSIECAFHVIVGDIALLDFDWHPFVFGQLKFRAVSIVAANCSGWPPAELNPSMSG